MSKVLENELKKNIIIINSKSECVLCHVRLFVTLWTVANQALLSMGLPRQEY